MILMRKVISALGGIFLTALLIAAVAPKATRGIAAALVQVVNTGSNPVPTREVGTGNEPFQTFLCADFGDQAGFCSPFVSSFTVPTTTSDGATVRRLVIESLSGECIGTNLPVQAAFLSVFTSANNVNGIGSGQGQFIAQPAPGRPTTQIYGASTRLYADPNTFVTLEVEAPFPSITGFHCQGTISGYLVTQ